MDLLSWLTDLQAKAVDRQAFSSNTSVSISPLSVKSDFTRYGSKRSKKNKKIKVFVDAVTIYFHISPPSCMAKSVLLSLPDGRVSGKQKIISTSLRLSSSPDIQAKEVSVKITSA